jgi:hypothetical protein
MSTEILGAGSECGSTFASWLATARPLPECLHITSPAARTTIKPPRIRRTAGDDPLARVAFWEGKLNLTVADTVLLLLTVVLGGGVWDMTRPMIGPLPMGCTVRTSPTKRTSSRARFTVSPVRSGTTTRTP